MRNRFVATIVLHLCSIAFKLMINIFVWFYSQPDPLLTNHHHTLLFWRDIPAPPISDYVIYVGPLYCVKDRNAMKRKTVSDASDDNDGDNDDDWGDERRVIYKKGKQLQVQENSSWAVCSSRNSSRLKQQKYRLFEVFNWNFISQRLLTMSTIFVGINDILYKSGSCSALR